MTFGNKMKTALIILGGLLICAPLPAYALKEAKAADYAVSGSVSSPVSKVNSYIDLNMQSTIADPANHMILITVNLLDNDKKPLAGRTVEISSNRGSVDIIEAASKISQYRVGIADISELRADVTDKNGRVSFRITSFVPGDVILSVAADYVVELGKQKVTYYALPFPANVTVGIDLPGTEKELNLISPKTQEENLSEIQKEAQKTANVGTKIDIPFWLFAVIFMVVVGCPVLIILIYLSLRKMRWMEREQTQLLKKMFPPNYNRQS